MLLAAHAQLMAGATDRAQTLLDRSLPNLDDAPLRAQAMRMQGVIRFSDGHGGETPSLLFQAAMGLKDTDPRLAREVLMEAFEAAMWAGRLTSGTTPLAVAEAARDVPAPDGDDHVGSLLLTAYTVRLTDSYASAVEAWRRAIAAYVEEPRGQPELKWDGVVWNATGELLDFEGHYATARAWARVSREQGALAMLPNALSALSWCEVLAGRIEAAEALIAEAEEIASATGAPATPGASEILKLGILCWRGDERKTRPVADSVAAEALARGQGLGMTIVEYLLTILELGLGRYEEARLHALRVFEEDVLWFGTYALADMVEATVRTGDEDAARSALDRLSERADASRTPWALGLLLRAGALLASDDTAELSIANRSTTSAIPAWRPSSRARICSTANGCGGRAGAATHGYISEPPTRSSKRWERPHSRTVRGSSCWPRANTRAHEHRRPATSSPHRNSRSPGSPPRASPTLGSRPSCSSAPTPSPTTCTRCSES